MNGIHLVKSAAPPLDPALKSWLDEIVIPDLLTKCLREFEQKELFCEQLQEAA